MAIAVGIGADSERRPDGVWERGESPTDRAVAGARAESLAGGLVQVAPFVPLGAAVILLFLYLVSLSPSGLGTIDAPNQVTAPSSATASAPGAASEGQSPASSGQAQVETGVLDWLWRLAIGAPISLAIVLSVVGWFVAAKGLCLARLTSPRYVNSSVFDDVLQRHISLRARLIALEAYIPHRPFERAAFEEARAHCYALGDELGRGGPGWVFGTSYINAWRLVHRGEEALLAVQPREDTVANATSDELRIRGSHMYNEADLIGQLRRAASVLAPNTPPLVSSASDGRHATQPASGSRVDAPLFDSDLAAVESSRDSRTADVTEIGPDSRLRSSVAERESANGLGGRDGGGVSSAAPTAGTQATVVPPPPSPG